MVRQGSLLVISFQELGWAKYLQIELVFICSAVITGGKIHEFAIEYVA
jgi:hypothetical protein